ncbi:recombinase family protein [Mesorhizobium sp. PUT5]|uniref:recombinase family protein n=1 Tax=Mesorhizobium sp. PUT5 TaxID=3454629 RepID=UPI003FA4A01C
MNGSKTGFKIPAMKIGYARVSTDEQNLDLQLQALHADGCELICEDKASGATPDRAGLTDALGRCGAGDVLVVWKLDRLGRSLIDLVVIVEALQARGAGLKILTGQGAQLDTTKPDGRMIFGILAIMAQFERELIGERAKAGLAAAKRRGVQLGRPPLLSPFQVDEARKMIAAGKLRREVAELLGVSPLTLRRALTACL